MNQMISKIVAVLAAVSIDILFVGLCMFIQASYRCLNQDLIEMDVLYAENSTVLPEIEKNFAQKIKKIVSQHCQIIQ
jgi:hypothetical protein